MNNLFYFKVLDSVKEYNTKQLRVILYELKLYSCALFLKNKFNDKRSVLQLIELIIEVYGLKHKTSRFLTRGILYS